MGFKYDKHNKYHRFGMSALITAVSLVVFVWVWWIASVIVQRQMDLNTSPLANPADAFAALFDLMRNGDPVEHRSMWSWIWSSLQKFFKGFVLAVVVALWWSIGSARCRRSRSDRTASTSPTERS